MRQCLYAFTSYVPFHSPVEPTGPVMEHYVFGFWKRYQSRQGDPEVDCEQLVSCEGSVGSSHGIYSVTASLSSSSYRIHACANQWMCWKNKKMPVICCEMCHFIDIQGMQSYACCMPHKYYICVCVCECGRMQLCKVYRHKISVQYFK